MKKKFISSLVFISLTVGLTQSQAQDNKWKKGILVDEFIYTEAPFPSAHASTIAETPVGLISAWFRGTIDGNKDVCIWTSHLLNNKWKAPAKVAEGNNNKPTRYPYTNPV